jgi:predicted  nucleic acid-binding Zn-ribbon protein
VLQSGLAAAFGFCAALFIVLLFAPAIARRISTLTWRQATRVLPQSSEEIAAARDHLRGQNAIQMRQLEMKMEAIAEKERQLRIGKQGFEDRIAALVGESDLLKNKVSALETESVKLATDLSKAGQDKALLATENAERDVRLATLSAEFGQLRSDHARQIAAFGLMQEAHSQLEQRLEASRNEASSLRSKVSAAESEVRMARSEAKRYESDAKLAMRKVNALEGKLERSIKLMAEAEEKLERREAELNRLKEQTKSAAPARLGGQAVSSEKQIPVKTAPSAPIDHVPVKSDPIVTQLKALRPALRAANRANITEQAHLKDEMMDLAGRMTAQAALQNAAIVTKIAQLKPGSALADAILNHHKAAE